MLWPSQPETSTMKSRLDRSPDLILVYSLILIHDISKADEIRLTWTLICEYRHVLLASEDADEGLASASVAFSHLRTSVVYLHSSASVVLASKRKRGGLAILNRNRDAMLNS